MAISPSENAALLGMRDQTYLGGNLEPTNENITHVGLRIALEVGKQIRESRNHLHTLNIIFKKDRSPQTNEDLKAEALTRKMLENCFPGHKLCGEEEGGDIGNEGISWAFDPIDGTWNFISQDSHVAFSMAAFRDEKSFFGVVNNPFTGELAYALEDEPSRLISLPIGFQQVISGYNLPALTAKNQNDVIVNLQPGTGYEPLLESLQKGREEGLIRNIRMTGGSPCNSLLDAAKGHRVYIHPWHNHPANAYDLAPGIQIVKNAGGKVVDLNGNEISEIGHTGTFIASVSTKLRDRVLNTLNSH